jgi:hypothetical protein
MPVRTWTDSFDHPWRRARARPAASAAAATTPAATAAGGRIKSAAVPTTPVKSNAVIALTST